MACTLRRTSDSWILGGFNGLWASTKGWLEVLIPSELWYAIPFTSLVPPVANPVLARSPPPSDTLGSHEVKSLNVAQLSGWMVTSPVP